MWRMCAATTGFTRATLCYLGICYGRSVRPSSVTSRSSVETAERIELVFGTDASFRLSYIVF